MPGPQKLVLIDGNSLAYRAYFSFQEFRTSAGVPTGAIFGFLRMLYKVLDDENPSHLAVAFDVAGPTFRDEWYEGYKANRQAAPDDFKVQLGPLRDVLRALRIPFIERTGYEADDLIGTLARMARDRGLETVIVTGDRDALQLVDDHVTVLLTRRGVTDVARMDRAAVQAAYGITPEQVVDLKSLMGDPSDNIPGVPGVGEKTAVRLLQRFGSLEGILQHLDQVPGQKLQEKLRQHEADARLSRRLATIDRDAPVDVDLEALRRQEPTYEEAQRLFRELEFRSLLPRITPPDAGKKEAARRGGGAPPAGPTPAGDGVPEVGAGAAAHAGPGGTPAAGEPARVELVAEAPAAAVRAEALPPSASVLAPVALAPAGAVVGPYGRIEPKGVAIVPPAEEGRPAEGFWFEPAALPGLDGYWGRAGDLTTFDAKPLYVWLLRRGVLAVPPAFDGAVAAYLLDPGRSTYRVEDLLRQHGLGDPPDPDSPGGRVVCAAHLGRLRAAMAAALREAGLWELFTEIEMPLLPLLARMEATGIRVDRAQLEAIGRELDERIAALQLEIWAAAGMEFNINSTKQLGEVLFEKLGLPTLKRTKTGYSTDAEVLEELASLHEVPAKILDYRTLVKLKSTYVDGLRDLVEPDGRVHTTFNQTVAATGRLSSADPNLQNIPIREEEGRRLRKAFIPEEGWVLFAADYSQIELRVLAHYSQDHALLDAFHRRQDVHTRTAAEVFGVPIDQVTQEMRRRAKCVARGTLVYTSEGLRPIESLGPQPKQGEFQPLAGVRVHTDGAVQAATHLYYDGVQPVRRVTLQSGLSITATHRHRFRVIDRAGNYVWKQVGDLEVGDCVAVVVGCRAFGTSYDLPEVDMPADLEVANFHNLSLPRQWTPELARFLGYLTSKGYVYRHPRERYTGSVVIRQPEGESEIAADIVNVTRKLFGDRVRVKRYGESVFVRIGSGKLVHWLTVLGFGGCAAEKTLPEVLLAAPEEIQREFLRALFAGDGSRKNQGCQLTYCTKSKELAERLHQVLLNFGYLFRLVEERRKGRPEPYYVLELNTNREIARFVAEIGLVAARKEAVGDAVAYDLTVIPHQERRVQAVYPYLAGRVREEVYEVIPTAKSVQLNRARASAIVAQLHDRGIVRFEGEELAQRLSMNQVYLPVVRIEETEAEVFDLSVPEGNTYLAAGLVSHNTVNFGLVYGQSDFGLARALRIGRGEARAFIERYFERYPGVKKYMEEKVREAREKGYVTTLLGRRRFLPDIHARTFAIRQNAERAAINTPIQGTAADLMKKAMLAVDREVRRAGLRARMLLQVHDELVFEAPPEEVDRLQQLIEREMVRAMELAVPLEVETRVGPNWYDMVSASEWLAARG